MNKAMIKSVVVLLVICLVISGLLAVINSFTAPVISAGAEERAAAARQVVMPDAATFEEVPEAETSDVTAVYKGLDASGNVVGYVFTSLDGGFGGNITVMTGIDAEGYITKCQALDLTAETATLGGQWANEEHTDKYIGLDEAGVAQAWTNGDIVISGSTITSSAFEDSVNKAFAVFNTLQ